MARRKTETLIDRWVKANKYRTMIDLGVEEKMSRDEAIEGLKLVVAVMMEMQIRLGLVRQAADFLTTLGPDVSICNPDAEDAK